jgi:hypothetical protein
MGNIEEEKVKCSRQWTWYEKKESLQTQNLLFQNRFSVGFFSLMKGLKIFSKGL